MTQNPEQLLSMETSKLMSLATDLRQEYWGDYITYSRKVFVPLTNMCRDTCGYCSFVKHPSHAEAEILSPDQILKIARSGEDTGCKELLFSLGEKPEQRYEEARSALAALGHTCMSDYIYEMCTLVLNETSLVPHVNAGTLERHELSALKEVSGSCGMMLENVSRRLTQKGFPHYACPDKVPVQRIRTLERAGEIKVPFTTGILIGIGESWQERIDSLVAIANLHKKYGHIQEVIVQNFQPRPGIAMENHPAPTLEDMLRTLAMARLILPPDISLQAPPNLSDRHTQYLAAGINDWGGISPVTIDHINPFHAWPEIEMLAKNTALMGCTLQERLTVYPAYQDSKRGYLAPEIAERVGNMARPDGYAKSQELR